MVFAILTKYARVPVQAESFQTPLESAASLSRAGKSAEGGTV